MLRWTSQELCDAITQSYFPNDKRLDGLDPSQPILDLLADLNRRLPDERMLMNVNFRTEVGEGLLAHHAIGGPDPGDGEEDAGYEVGNRILFGLLGGGICLLPLCQMVPGKESEIESSVYEMLDALPQYPLGNHPNIIRAWPPGPERTFGAIAFFENGAGEDHMFARFYYPKRVRVDFAGRFFRDAWEQMHARRRAS